MSDSAGARLEIGGHILARIVPTLCRLIHASTVTIEDDGALYTPKSGADLVNALDPNSHLVLRSLDTPGGEFTDLETWLRSQRIGYSRWHDAGEHFSAGVSHYRARYTHARHFLVDRQEQIYIPESLLHTLHRLFITGKRAHALKLLQTCTTRAIPPLPRFLLSNQ